MNLSKSLHAQRAQICDKDYNNTVQKIDDLNTLSMIYQISGVRYDKSKKLKKERREYSIEPYIWSMPAVFLYLYVS